MATIQINEISKNYTYTTGLSNFCTVALPMTASWGPGFEDPETLGLSLDQVLEGCAFSHFPSTSEGLDAFIAAYRGPAANYRSAKDFSYQIALTLLTAGYDLDVCRVCSGAHASASINATIDATQSDPRVGSITFKAKYAGSFGNNLICTLKKVMNRNYWNIIVYIVDASGIRTAVENMVFVFNADASTDTILHVSELESRFIDIVVNNIETDDNVTFSAESVQLTGGSDRKADGTAAQMMDEAIDLAVARYNAIVASDVTDYKAALTSVKNNNPTVAKAAAIRYMEWNYNAALYVLDILVDKLSYSSKRLIMPGWDDQNFWFLTGETVRRISTISPLHAKMMEVAAQARCMTALLDLPKSLERSGVWNDSADASTRGYTQVISSYTSQSTSDSDGLFSTHSALFGPWCQYVYSGTGKNNIAPPGFIALMLQLGMLANQSLQYEWILPDSRTHNVVVGKPDYTVPKKLLDNWQSTEGASLNVLVQLPDLGTTIWGNSTCFDVPVATYNALQNLSTRYLMNAVKDRVFRAGVGITFQYNNDEAYTRFYIAVQPLLDTMKMAGAITAYTIEMSKDINGIDSVNMNSVIGKVTMWVEGVINDITVDLIALPAGTESTAQ